MGMEEYIGYKKTISELLGGDEVDFEEVGDQLIWSWSDEDRELRIKGGIEEGGNGWVEFLLIPKDLDNEIPNATAISQHGEDDDMTERQLEKIDRDGERVARRYQRAVRLLDGVTVEKFVSEEICHLNCTHYHYYKGARIVFDNIYPMSAYELLRGRDAIFELLDLCIKRELRSR